MCNIAPENITGNRCGTLGGLAVIAYYAYSNDIATFPAPPVPGADYADSATVATDFVMKPGKYFYKAVGDLELPSLSGESAGGVNNLSAANKYRFAQAGTRAQVVGFINSIKNRSVVFLVQDLEGNTRIIGQDGLFAKMESFREATGAKVADEKVIEFTIYAPGNLAYFYTGVVPLEPELPEFLIVDENDNPLVDENDNYIVYE
jgi:hypothetical protein